ncbi:helix-turn-helix domain-containing protein [Peribacillus frigoritolerans]|uniref:Helix-turn-helix domain-containing protein n=1 Tax=Peribacillus castrilensis TaxID=2897690 RepID=A0AAW9NKC1_9BACI|nr:helix-turn-helix domain-containing protein [Peribacillus castrilensis]MEC0301343.1 helix-turn-helix domain-containing protein [Peribacillus castrilensis]
MKKKSNKIIITEAAEILGVSKGTVTYWARTGHFKAEREHGRWVIDRESLQEFKDSRSNI